MMMHVIKKNVQKTMSLMIFHGICGVYSDYNSGYRQQTPVMLCLPLLTPWGARDAAMRTNHSHHYLPNNPIAVVIIIFLIILVTITPVN